MKYITYDMSNHNNFYKYMIENNGEISILCKYRKKNIYCKYQ